MSMFLITEFLNSFHKAIWGAAKSVDIFFYDSYFNKSLLRHSGYYSLRKDSKRVFIIEKICYYYSFNVL